MSGAQDESDVRVAGAYPVGSSVLARVAGKTGWYVGTVVGVPGAEASKRPRDTVCVVSPEGAWEDIATGNLRLWNRPEETVWHKRRKARNHHATRHVEAANRQSTLSAVVQLDIRSGADLARWASAKKAAEAVPGLADAADVVASCRGQQAQAGGYKWRFADPRHKVDTADVDEMIRQNYAIEIQKDNPKKVGTKSAELYDLYKAAASVKQMLDMGGRRADVAYDINHGWITFVDPDLNARFTGGAALTDEPPRADEPDSDDEAEAEPAAARPAPSDDDHDNFAGEIQ